MVILCFRASPLVHKHGGSFSPKSALSFCKLSMQKYTQTVDGRKSPSPLAGNFGKLFGKFLARFLTRFLARFLTGDEPYSFAGSNGAKIQFCKVNGDEETIFVLVCLLDSQLHLPLKTLSPCSSTLRISHLYF